MSYPPYPSGPGGGYPPYPNPYPTSNPVNYGFPPDMSSYPQPQPQVFPSAGYMHPEASGNIAAYPTASWSSNVNSSGGLPYSPQPQQVYGGPPQSYSPYATTQPGLPPNYPTGQPSPALYPSLGGFPSNPSQPVSGVPSYSTQQPGYGAPSYGTSTPSYGTSTPSYGTSTPSYGNPTLQYASSSPYQTSSSPTAIPKHQKMANYGTVKEHQPFQPEQDAQVLRKAMKGFGTDEKAIIEVLAKRTNGQRQQIYITYKSHFGRDLIQDLKSELSGHVEDVIVAMMSPIPHYLATQLHRAIEGLGTDEAAIIEILCSRSNHEVQEINEAYKKLYGKALEKHLMEDTSGHFRKLLVSLGMANRDESEFVDQGRAAQDAQRLYQAGEARWGTDESTFNSILVTQSYTQLKAVFAEYHRQTGKSITHSIKTEFSGDVEKGLLTIVKCVENTPSYFAERLYHSMAGAGTDDRTLIRIITTRCEVDMILIKQEFQRMFGKTLESFIAGDTSGDYKRVLLALVQ